MFKLRDALLIAALLTGIQVGAGAHRLAGRTQGCWLALLAMALADVYRRHWPRCWCAAAFARHRGSALMAAAGAAGSKMWWPPQWGWRFALAVALGSTGAHLAFVGVLALLHNGLQGGSIIGP